MARIRTIKPEFWTNEDLAEVSESSCLLAIGLLNHCDDEGYFKAHESLIKATVFPLRDPSMTIHGCLTELSNAGYLRLFKGSDGKRYGHIINFLKHQVIQRPKDSKIKPLECGQDESLKDHVQINDESMQEGNGMEQGMEHDIKSGASDEPSEPAVFELPTNKHNTTGQTYPIPQSKIDEWAEAFPACNVLGELRQMKVWLDENKSKRKTLGGMGKFVANWLSRTQNNGGSKTPPPQDHRPSHRKEMPKPDRPPRRD